MEMQHDNVGDVRKVVLVGRLDTAGVDLVETKFGAAIVPNGKNTIVDLTQVTFLASMGIRMVISVPGLASAIVMSPPWARTMSRLIANTIPAVMAISASAVRPSCSNTVRNSASRSST